MSACREASISGLVREIKERLLRLVRKSEEREANAESTAPNSAVEDSLQKFSLWAGNTGASHRTKSKLSLEQRLAEAPEIRDQVLKLLGELLEHASYLGHIRSRDGSGLTEAARTQEPDDDIDSSSSDESSVEDEAQVMVNLISECLRSLFRIAIVIRKATQRDRFRRAQESRGGQFINSFDVDYVRHKHSKLEHKQWLLYRLGTAIAKRRQMIKYCRDHRLRLEAGGDDATQDNHN